MSIFAQTLKAVKTVKDFRSSGEHETVQLWSLTDDEEELSRIQREAAAQSLKLRPRH